MDWKSKKSDRIQGAWAQRLVVPVVTLSILLVAFGTISVVYRQTPEDRLRKQLEKERSALDKSKNAISQLESELSKTNGIDGGTTESETMIQNVTVQTVHTAPFIDRVSLPGVVEASEDILLAARSDGAVDWIGPRKGENVKKGQEIARIDTNTLREQFRSAEAAERYAEQNLKRIEALAKSKVTSQEELDQAESQYKQTQAATAVARVALEDATLVSTIDGTVDDIPIDAGEFVDRGDTVARIVDISSVKLRIGVPESDIAYLKTGLSVLVQNPAPTDGTTTGTVTRIGLVADDSSKTFTVEATIANPEGIFRPGMITKVELIRSRRENAVSVSFYSVIQTLEGPIVYVERGGKAVERPIQVGMRQGSTLEVLEGLGAGDRLVVKGQREVTNGASVRVMEVLP
jgi:membrane fusion protein (multidrug efflux system)